MKKIITNFNISGSKNPNFKTGKFIRIRFCAECNNQITPGSESGLCKSCSRKGNRNPQFRKQPRLNKKHTETTKDKIRLKNLGKKYSEETNKKKGLSGILNPNYINGLSNFPYPLEFNEELKNYIRKRDNYECQLCFLTNEEHLIIWNKSLDVHHIDYDKLNCYEDNLVSLCIQCHMKTNYNRYYWKEIFSNKTRIKEGIKNGY